MGTEEKLRAEIYKALRKVTKKSCPNVYERIQTEEGYSQIENKIINMVIHDSITPSACIPHIESEL